MSLNGVELVLYDLGTDRTKRSKFKEDLEGFLADYPLDEAERAEIADFDVKALAERGANTMLTMGFWQMASEDRSMRTYLKAMNA